MNLSEMGSLASIGSFTLAAILFLIQYWDKIVEKGASIFTILPLIFLIIGIISSSFAVYTSWYIYPLRKELKLSTQEEMVLKKLIQEYKEPSKESSMKIYTLPPLGERAVPDIFLPDRPKLKFTDKEIQTIIKMSPKIAKEILKNQIEWGGYADIANAAVEGYRDYIRSIFGGEKAK
jgi:hypothetical protein